MSQQRGTETNQLVNVIEVIQLGRKTGVLTVERGADSHVEMGEITFMQGRITYVRSSRIGYKGVLDGQQALSWLNTWGPCRFIFVASSSPIVREKVTQPILSIRRRGSTQTLQDTQPRLHTTHTLPAVRTTEPLVSGTGKADSEFNLHSIVPHRILQAEEALRRVNQAGLSRMHLHLLLLIDGQRSVTELIRLTGRKQDEVRKLLRDLAYIGVIQ